MEQTECSETLAFKLQTPGNNPEEIIWHSEQGEGLKSRRINPGQGISDEIPSFFKLLSLYGVGDRRMNEYGSLVEWFWQRKSKVLGEISSSVSLIQDKDSVQWPLI
jgi:hypothetical protein